MLLSYRVPSRSMCMTDLHQPHAALGIAVLFPGKYTAPLLRVVHDARDAHVSSAVFAVSAEAALEEMFASPPTRKTESTGTLSSDGNSASYKSAADHGTERLSTMTRMILLDAAQPELDRPRTRGSHLRAWGPVLLIDPLVVT